MNDRKSYQKQYYEQNKQKIKDRAKAHYDANREEAIARANQWQKDNREAHNAAVAKYDKSHPEIVVLANKRYREKHGHTLLYKQRRIVNATRKRSLKKGWAFDIDLEYIQEIWPKDNRCPIFGTEFTYGTESLATVASVDRLDSTKGYIKGNVHIISYRANTIKNDSTLDELRTLVGYLSSLQG